MLEYVSRFFCVLTCVKVFECSLVIVDSCKMCEFECVCVCVRVYVFVRVCVRVRACDCVDVIVCMFMTVFVCLSVFFCVRAEHWLSSGWDTSLQH